MIQCVRRCFSPEASRRDAVAVARNASPGALVAVPDLGRICLPATRPARTDRLSSCMRSADATMVIAYRLDGRPANEYAPSFTWDSFASALGRRRKSPQMCRCDEAFHFGGNLRRRCQKANMSPHNSRRNEDVAVAIIRVWTTETLGRHVCVCGASYAAPETRLKLGTACKDVSSANRIL